jgi:hypothetical protein
MSDDLGRYPLDIFEEYQEAKQDLISYGMNLGRALRESAPGSSVDYWHARIMERSQVVEQLRAAILKDEQEPPAAD